MDGDMLSAVLLFLFVRNGYNITIMYVTFL